MHRSPVAIPIAMMFVAASMMFTTLGAVPALGTLRVICWVAGPTFALVGLVTALRRLRQLKREFAEQSRQYRES